MAIAADEKINLLTNAQFVWFRSRTSTLGSETAVDIPHIWLA
jgi:hypothetical protein